MNLTIKKTIFMMAMFFAALFSACQSDDRQLNEDTRAINPKLMSIEEVLAKVKNPLLKKSIADEVQPKLLARGIGGADEAYNRYFEVMDLDRFTNYNLFMSDYTEEAPYYTFFVVTIDNDDAEKAVYLKFYPDEVPTRPFNIKRFTGELQLEDITGQVAGRFRLLGGTTGPLQPVTEGCITTITIKESLCTHGGEHHVGEACAGAGGNDAYYYFSASTSCTYLVALGLEFGGGGNGGAANSVSATTAFFNNLSNDQNAFLNTYENKDFKAEIIKMIGNAQTQTNLVKMLIDHAMVHGTQSVMPFFPFLLNPQHYTFKTALQNFLANNDFYSESKKAFAIKVLNATIANDSIKQTVSYLYGFIDINGDSVQTYQIADALLALANVNNSIAEDIVGLMNSPGGNITELHDLANWSAAYLTNNPTVTTREFRNRFMGKSEGQDGEYDAVYWDNPSLVFPAQNLPTWANFSAAFPKDTDPLYDTPQKMYTSIGGQVLSFYSGPNTNTCAIRLSKALNYSGVTIPHIPGKTFKGADNKYYFKAAYEINTWMRKTFGTNPATSTTPYNSNHYQYTATQAGTHGINLPSLLTGKKGIYSIFSSNFTWASGHADLLNSNATCANNCHFYDAPIGRLDVWVLN